MKTSLGLRNKAILFSMGLLTVTSLARADWPMPGANAQRTSWVSQADGGEVRGVVQVEWYRTILPYIDHKSEVVAAENKLFIATSRGLYCFDANGGAGLWTYGTEMPIGHSPTYSNGKIYFGCYDRRIHAVDADIGGKVWTSAEAGAGFETNPLVVNGKVFAGNRDGYFYCFDAENGGLVWKWRDDQDEYPNAPIRFSAAYKDGVVYFASDNSHAYALTVDGVLRWKSEKLPGTGFSTYWPVVYTEKSTGRDYVIFSGSKKSTFGWFADDYYFKENYDIFSGVPFGALVGTTGSEAGDWAVDTMTIDAGKVSNYFANNPHKRHFFVLDSGNGTEFNGYSKEYAPMSWVSTTHGGNKRPPVIGADGAIYTHIGYKNGNPNESPNMGASGGISGWKFGTQYVSRIYDFERGFADEAVQFTAGGNLIYWSEGFNMPLGAMDISKPFGSENHWEYMNTPNDLCYVAPDFWDQFTCCLYCGSKVYKGPHSGVGMLGGGGSLALIPYNNSTLFMLHTNALIAFSTRGGSARLTTTPQVSSQTPDLVPLSDNLVRQRLEAEIRKIIAAGHLRPGFHDSGIWSGATSGLYAPYIPGNRLTEYFHNPADTLWALVRALPHLTSSLQEQVKEYLQSEMQNYPVYSIAHVGWKKGAQREISDDTPELSISINAGVQIPSTPSGTVTGGGTEIWGFPQDSFYGAWKYAQIFPSEARGIFEKMKGKLEANSMTNSDLIRYPYILNQYIAGYRGYMELERMAGHTTDISQSAQWSEYNRLLNLRLDSFSKTNPFLDDFDYNNAVGVARNFMFLVPELAEELRNRKFEQVREAVNQYNDIFPYWFVSKYDLTWGEGVYQPLYDYNAMFQAKALILKEPYEQLVKYLDVPGFWRGDLFYIHNLAAALELADSSPPGIERPAPPTNLRINEPAG